MGFLLYLLHACRRSRPKACIRSVQGSPRGAAYNISALCSSVQRNRVDSVSPRGTNPLSQHKNDRRLLTGLSGALCSESGTDMIDSLKSVTAQSFEGKK